MTARIIFAVDDLDAARRFYVHALGCSIDGREDDTGLDLDFHGHALSLVLASVASPERVAPVVPSDAAPHAPVVLGVDAWCTVSERLRARGIAGEIETPRRPGVLPGEQCALCLTDPAGNALRIAGFAQEPYVLAA